MDPKMNRITRYGAYGTIVEGCNILLVVKKSGPLKGLWGLPGGAIEFGETPEDALKRELLEEIAMEPRRLQLLNVVSVIGNATSDNEPYEYHHVGIIYEVFGAISRPELIPEEKERWVSIKDIVPQELTPFARHVLIKEK